MAGRKPKLEADNKTLHRSNAELKAREEATPVYAKQEFVPPKDLTVKELEYWKWLVDVFRNTIKCQINDCDIHAMKDYCYVRAQIDEAREQLLKDNRPYMVVKTGVLDKQGVEKVVVKPNVYKKQLKENIAESKKIATELGLNAVGRAKQGLAKAQGDEEIDILEELNKRTDD